MFQELNVKINTKAKIKQEIATLIEISEDILQKLIDDTDDSYWGFDEFIDASNDVMERISNVVGFDIAEDEQWSGYTNNATPEEICKYNIIRLQRFRESTFVD